MGDNGGTTVLHTRPWNWVGVTQRLYRVLHNGGDISQVTINRLTHAHVKVTEFC